MSTYTVEQIIGEPRDWQTKAGKAMKSYTLKVSGEDRNVELSQIPATPAPTVGQVIEGTIEESQGNFAPKLKKAGGFGGGGGRSDKDWEASGRAQGRAHAQEMALTYCQLRGRGDVSWDDLMKLADKFFDDAQAAKAEGYRS